MPIFLLYGPIVSSVEEKNRYSHCSVCYICYLFHISQIQVSRPCFYFSAPSVFASNTIKHLMKSKRAMVHTYRWYFWTAFMIKHFKGLWKIFVQLQGMKLRWKLSLDYSIFCLLLWIELLFLSFYWLKISSKKRSNFLWQDHLLFWLYFPVIVNPLYIDCCPLSKYFNYKYSFLPIFIYKQLPVLTRKKRVLVLVLAYLFKITELQLDARR